MDQELEGAFGREYGLPFSPPAQTRSEFGVFICSLQLIVLGGN